MRKFIVLATQRSGSTYLCQWLNSHPEVRCHDELFYHHAGPDTFKAFCMAEPRRRLGYAVFCAADVMKRVPGNIVRDRLLEQFLENVFENPAHPRPFSDRVDQLGYDVGDSESRVRERAVGFKFMYSQARRFPQLVDRFVRDRYTVVDLVRENLLKMYLSKLTAKVRGFPHATRRPSVTRVRVDVKMMHHYFRRAVRHRDAWRARVADLPTVTVVYEQFFECRDDIADSIADALGVERGRWRAPRLAKLNPDSVASIVENYDEVAAALRGTRYAGFLEE